MRARMLSPDMGGQPLPNLHLGTQNDDRHGPLGFKVVTGPQKPEPKTAAMENGSTRV